MKMTNWVTTILAAGVLAMAGCGKSKPAPGRTVEGVTVETAKLQQAFAAGSPELQNGVAAVKMSVRYGDWAAALATLEKMANNPSLTEPQKQVVALVTEQVKQVASKPPTPPAQ